MEISIIIPTLNEASNIAILLDYLEQIPAQDKIKEILVVDAGSKDGTADIANQRGAKVLISPIASRAIQMNYGAQNAIGNILYFLHADVTPPSSFIEDILETMDSGFGFGCFAYQLDKSIGALRINSFFTQFNLLTTGGGDQSLFIGKQDFLRVGGFDEQLPIMEDFDFVWRTKKVLPFTVIKKNKAIVSARRYEKYGYCKVQLVDTFIFFAFYFGVSPQRVHKWYRTLLY